MDPDAKRSRQAGNLLPSRASDVVDVLDHPTDLLNMSSDRFDALVDEFVERGVPVLHAIEQGAGVIAWAARHHFPDSHYGAWLHRFAQQLGRHDDTVTRWRDKAVQDLGLPVPRKTQERSQARLAAAARALRRSAAPRPRTAGEEAAVIELGGISSPSLQSAVALVLVTPAEVLADSTTTAQLEQLRTLVDEAIACQRRTVLRARSANRRPSRTA